MCDFKEIEFKYYADEISREAFDSAVKSIGGIKKEQRLHSVSENGKDSVDHYFTNKDSTRFMRWREGQTVSGNKTWELTSKIKLSDKNNNLRTEVNIPINSSGMVISKAKEFSKHHGCEYDFSIRKDVQIYWIGKVVLSHYTTYDYEGNKLHTFMEIEADESYSWESDEEALNEIVEWEKKLSCLNITPQNRIKRSLFELYTGKIKTNSKIQEYIGG